ncbi:MAG: DUF3016 domain-containing protein [Rhodanobacteraceae bacterium]
MHISRVIGGIGLASCVLAFAGIARAGTATVVDPAAPASVSVVYEHPGQFSEARESRFSQDVDHDYLQTLRTFLVRRATPMLQPGEHLTITFTNVKLAGSYEPWRGPLWQDVRFMRDIYPPRFDFSFRLTGPDGVLVREGTRKLTGLGYLYTLPPATGTSGPLHYDKALLAQWLRRGPQRW